MNIAQTPNLETTLRDTSLSAISMLARRELAKDALLAAGTVRVASKIMFNSTDEVFRYNATRIVIYLVAADDDQHSDAGQNPNEKAILFHKSLLYSIV